MIREATQDDIHEILSSPGVKERVPHAEGKPNYPSYIINDRMLALIKEASTEDVEFHVMAPKSAWRELRDDVGYLVSLLRDAGYKNIYTGIDNQYRRTQNLAIKCGFIPIYRAGSEVVYRCQ